MLLSLSEMHGALAITNAVEYEEIIGGPGVAGAVVHDREGAQV